MQYSNVTSQRQDLESRNIKKKKKSDWSVELDWDKIDLHIGGRAWKLVL